MADITKAIEFGHRVQVVEMMAAIRPKIFNGEFNSMREIGDECLKVAGDLNMTPLEREYMYRTMYEAYIIHCSVEKIVPNSGY